MKQSSTFFLFFLCILLYIQKLCFTEDVSTERERELKWVFYSSDRPFKLHCLFGPSFFTMSQNADAYRGERPKKIQFNMNLLKCPSLTFIMGHVMHDIVHGPCMSHKLVIAYMEMRIITKIFGNSM